MRIPSWFDHLFRRSRLDPSPHQQGYSMTKRRSAQAHIVKPS